MHGILRHIMAVMCIAAYICSGQMTGCACALAAEPASACESHDHSHAPDHQDHAPGADAACPCVACHACSHAPIVMPQVEFALPLMRPKPMEQVATAALTRRALEIFTPPKLS